MSELLILGKDADIYFILFVTV